MSLYPGLDAPRTKAYKTIWTGIFFVALILGMASLYLATKSVDYVWRWYQVPDYFFYQEDVETLSEIEGYISGIKTEGEKTLVTVQGVGETETYTLPTESLLAAEGDFIYPGDPLGSQKKWQTGLLLYGLWITLKASFMAIILAMVIGIATGLMRISDNPALKWSAITYIELVRGSPLLVQLMIWYFVIGTLINRLLMDLGFSKIPTLWFGILSLAIFTGAYTAEIVRAGIQSVNIGQMEAARSLGMSYPEAMRKVIMPQAINRILPALAGQFISLIKDSSLLGVISVRELTKVTREVVTANLQPFELWIVCAGLYLVLTFGFSLLVQRLETRAV
ncbi:ABC transporter permease [Desulfoluna limicola]|uniref:ABC transporter permease n=1 Tax=Desulfoluna limicola TaxID=2810562 RepID=A0ABN6F3T1_9BACT|nr:amino acid ABC transporter permease [Desulfoluna limicola]BCS96152.1 ABC transporter permease [Desulfoluna limicola]